ncbi:MAG TPA: AMP-binding protein, partial [Ktedonobacteraceae bacterium]|nr:AMP-binding protein [Ktedonobacteraceae bacterium]
FYTSGTTGDPKGVGVTHQGVIHYCMELAKAYHYSVNDRVLQFASLSFDTCCEEIYPALFSGATVVLRDDEMAFTPSICAQRVNAWHISILNMPTAFWHRWCNDIAETERLDACVRLVIVGGEQAYVRALEQWKMYAGPQADWINTYGPTETSIAVTRYDPQVHGWNVSSGVPIGYPVAQGRVYLLDQHLQPVPSGLSGEIYIGGPGVARGYIGKPDTTALSFLPDPFTTIPGSRVYRTGDRAFMLPDGDLIFLGRNDRQIKIRGYRVNLNEVEAILRRVSEVKDALVLMRDDHDNQAYLIAYILASDPSAPPQRQKLRYFLQGRIPMYMVPTHFVVLDSFPTTSHGKIDLRALPLPEEITPDEVLVVQKETATNPIEDIVIQIWADVLHLSTVDTHATFFVSGGHSLLATSLLSRLNSAFGTALPIRVLFDTPTIAGLVEAISAQLQLPSYEQMPALIKQERTPGETFPLSFAQQRLWFLDRLEPESALYTIPLLLRLQGELDVQGLTHALTQVLQRHEILRTRFIEREGQPLQEVLAIPTFAIEQHELLALPQEEREAHARLLLQQAFLTPFDLTTPPLLRAHLVSLAPDDRLLLLLFPHIAFDDWSSVVLLREVGELYQAWRQQRPASLPELPIQYADYSLWQRQTLQGETLRQLEAFWLTHLAEAPSLLELPADAPRPAQPSFRGALLTWTLPDPLASRVLAFARAQDVTPFMFFLACFAVLLSRLSQQDDLVIGTPIANRQHPATQQLLGCFLNTLPLRLHLPGSLPFLQFLHQVRETALDAYQHQDLPFEHLVELLNPPRHLTAHPLFQVLLNVLQADPGPVATETALHWELDALQGSLAKFDLSLSVSIQPTHLSCSLEYNQDLFTTQRITQWMGYFQTLIEGILDQPARHLDRLPLLSAAQQQSMLQLLAPDFSRTPDEHPAGMTIPALIFKQVQHHPHAIALVSHQESLTYFAMFERASLLAHHLLAQDLPAESTVGVAFERSIDLILCLLAVLLAGGAYVPLDPDYPADRLAYIAQDAQVSLVLTSTSLLERLPDFHSPLLCLDDLPALKTSTLPFPLFSLHPQHLAYVIYTSGSTGRPKGAMNTHAGVCNRLTWMRDAYRLGPHERFLLKTPYSFDVSVGEIFTPLISGATLVLSRPQGQADPEYLVQFMEQQDITTVHFVPSLLPFFLAQSGLNRLTSLHRVMCSGEALTPDLCFLFRQRLPQVALHNL